MLRSKDYIHIHLRYFWWQDLMRVCLLLYVNPWSVPLTSPSKPSATLSIFSAFSASDHSLNSSLYADKLTCIIANSQYHNLPSLSLNKHDNSPLVSEASLTRFWSSKGKHWIPKFRRSMNQQQEFPKGQCYSTETSPLKNILSPQIIIINVVVVGVVLIIALVGVVCITILSHCPSLLGSKSC